MGCVIVASYTPKPYSLYYSTLVVFLIVAAKDPLKNPVRIHHAPILLGFVLEAESWERSVFREALRPSKGSKVGMKVGGAMTKTDLK